ncbi:hypothetical protein IIV30_056R [Invertebrate iridescent virus 30]|uniref:Uncharacterized protein n=1 Tax=Invertebrate iridescent virus 30 TaxID=345585 RepID=W8W257_9VIRU|nr:hypothetical protein IIV30_056R [Invertebrate iridescent virus 30]CCV02251.1 hypothetical protein IIV30_056R [Invertebrate iridescent virus 30]
MSSKNSSEPHNDIFNTPILQSFLVKTNLSINLNNLVSFLPLSDKVATECYRSGTIIALKYKDTTKGQDDLFKTKNGFKNACHLIMCHTLNKRKKKMIHIKITTVGTFQIVGIPAVDVEKVVYKIFLVLEKINKINCIFKYVSAETSHNTKTDERRGSIEHNRLEIVIVPILNNYMLTLDQNVTDKIFQNSKVQIVQKFIDNNFLSFMVPNDPAITIKKSFVYEDFSAHPIQYIVWNKKYGKTEQYIEYDSYTTILKGAQLDNARSKKYLTLRLYSTGKVLVSGFDEILIQQGVKDFLNVCNQFSH